MITVHPSHDHCSPAAPAHPEGHSEDSQAQRLAAVLGHPGVGVGRVVHWSVERVGGQECGWLVEGVANRPVVNARCPSTRPFLRMPPGHGVPAGRQAGAPPTRSPTSPFQPQPPAVTMCSSTGASSPFTRCSLAVCRGNCRGLTAGRAGQGGRAGRSGSRGRGRQVR